MTIHSQDAFHLPADPTWLRFLARNSPLTPIRLVVAEHEVAPPNVQDVGPLLRSDVTQLKPVPNLAWPHASQLWVLDPR